MTKASVAAKEHAIQTKGLSGTTDTFVAKQKVVQTELEATAASSRLASVGVKALSTAFNMFAGIAIMWGVTKIIEGFEYISESAERAKEKLAEIQTELSDNNSTYQSNRDTLVGLKDEYDALTKKAESLGGAQNLANDEYERYQAITSQILGITPKLTTGWNNEGEAISNKNNLLQASIDLLDEEYEKSLRNNTTKSKNEDVASGVIAKMDEFNSDPDTQYRSGTMADMRESFIDELKKLETELGMTEHDIVEKMWAYLEPNADPNDFWSEHIDTYEKLRVLIEKDYDKFANSFVDKNNPIYELFSDEVIDNMIRNADAYFYEAQRILSDREALYQNYKDQLNWNAQATRDKSGNNAYQQLTDNGKAFVNEYIEGLDYASIKTEEDFVEMANDIQKFTKLLASNDNVSKLVEDIFTPANENETSAQYVERVQIAISDIQQYCKDNYIDLPINFTTLDDVGRMTEGVQAFLSDEFDDKVGELSLGDLQIASELEIDSSTLLSWDELLEKIQKVKDETSNEEITVPSFSSAFNAKDFADTKEKLLELAKAGELTPYTLSSTKEYKTLLDQTGLTAEQVYKKIMKVAKKSMDISDWQTTLNNSRKNIVSLKEMKNALKEDGISAVSGDVISNFPELIGYLESESELRKGINGLIGDYEAKANEAYFNLVQDSEVYYSNLKKNESDKLNTASKTINSIVNANKTLVEQLGGAYNVDLKNFKSVAQAKAQLEQQLIINSAKAWSKYYKVQLDASKNTAKVVANGDFNSGGTGGSDSIKAYEEASKAQNAANASAKAYNEAINSLKKITSTTINPQITSPDPTDPDKAKKSTTKFSQAIDWCAQTLSKLSKTIDLYSAKLDRNTNSVKTQIKYYKELLNAQNNIVKGYAKTESKYKSTYTKALKKLSKSDQKKVKEGTYTIEQFSGKSKKSGKKSSAEKRYNNIQKALEARDNYLDAQTDSVNAKNKLQEYAEELASIRWDKATEQVEKLNNQVSVLDTRMSNVSGYKAKNKVLSEQLKLQKKILTKQENAYANTQSDANSVYKKISSKYKKNKNSDGTIKTKGVTNQTQLKYIKEYNAYVKELAKDEIELAQAQEDYTAAVQEASVARAEYIKTDYDNKISLIDAKANQLDSQISLAEAKGQVASVEFYKQLQNNSNQRKTELEAEKKALQKQLANTRAYTDEWYEVKQMVIEVDEAIADETLNAVENINKQIEAMEKLKEAKNNYLSSTIGTYDWLESLTDTDDYYDEDGSLSDKGKAVAKGKIDKIKLYEQQAKNAQKNIDDLDAMYANNKDDPTYLNKRIELVEEWQNATKSMYDEQQSLHDMYINGLKEESEALQELIDKKMESLKADKAEYDYQKSIAEKTKNVTDLEKQLAMLEGDNSEEARAKRQKVKVELEEAQQDLEDTQYDKYLERLENSLGDLQDRFDAVIEKLDKQGALPSIEEMQKLTDDNASDVTKGVDKIIKEAGLDKLLGEEGIGSLNKTTAELLSTPSTGISDKITATNKWLNKIYTALPTDGSSGTTEEDVVSIAEALGTYDSKNKTADTSGKSALNKYIMSQGYSAMDEEQMVTLKDAILNSKYSEGMDASLKETLTNIASADNLKKDKDANSSNNKNAIMNALKYTKANEFISKNATKATKKKSEYGILNKKIYDITGGKVLSKADTLKLGSIFNVKDTDKSGGINADEAKKLVKLLENAGFANGGIVEAVHKSGDDGIAKLKVGEAVLTPVQTTAFTELAENIVPFNNLIGDIVERPNIPTVDRGAGAMTNNTIESVNFEFTLPNVTDKESLLNMIRNDKEVQRAFQNSTVGLLMSGNKQFNSRRL